MLVKHPKPQIRKWIKRGAFVAFVFEAGAFAASYFGWSKINTDRESRKYLKDNYPYILDAYYKTGELISSDNKVREIDQAYWDAETSTQEYPGLDNNTKQVYTKKEQFTNILEAAAKSEKPFYRLTKEEIDRNIKK